MFRALIFAVKIGLLAAAAIWIAQHPGEVQLEWLDYHVTAHVGLVLLVLFALLLTVLVIHRMLLAVILLPKNWQKRRARSRHEKGFQNLTQGLTAVAAGDTRLATDYADKTRKLWPKDKGLSLLLEAQAARLRGEEDVARSSFQKLLENKDTAFLGLRGLLVNALERGDTAMALALAQKAQKMHPRQPWIISMLYDLEVQERRWLDASKTLKRAQRYRAIDDKRAHNDNIAMLLAQAEDEEEKGRSAVALKLCKAAHRLDITFTPATIALAQAYLARGKKGLAKGVIEKSWKMTPHRDLVPLWGRAMPPAKKNSVVGARFKWFEQLARLNTQSVEGQMAAAQAALDEQLWGEARQYLDKAIELQPNSSSRLCRLYATLEEHCADMDESHMWLERAAQAPAEEVWVCRETGRIYERWSPVAQPHGTFNSIVWDFPMARAHLTSQALLPQNELLITAK